MKVIIAPDSFKGSLTALEAARAIKKGIHNVDSNIETTLLPVADGGEGTMDTLVQTTDGKIHTYSVKDPLGRTVEASFGVLGDGKTCVIEIAQASGLLLLDDTEKNPLITSTYGTGQLILHALDAGFRRFIIGLGGSATNDAGVGMLRALGMEFVDKNGTPIKAGGGTLIDLATIDVSKFDQRIAESTFIIASDVENPLTGKNGASLVFGPQKGATEEMVAKLDQSLTHLANIIENNFGISLHNEKGAGAAGGLGAALLAFFPAEMKSGIDVVLRANNFYEHMKQANIVITGEGKSDVQTLLGKAPYGIATIAKKFNKPVILISGVLEDETILTASNMFTEMHAIVDGTVSKEESMLKTDVFLRRKTEEIITNYLQL